MEREAQRDLNILNEIAQGGPVTQRSIAQRLNIALGLANLYLKRLARKGYIKVTSIPPSRVRYLLTPKGLAEKTRLTYEYMEFSLQLYRVARQALRAGLAPYVGRAQRRVAIYGTSEEAELAYLTLRELGLDVAAIVGDDGQGTFLGYKVCPVSELDPEAFDCVVLATFRPTPKQVRSLTDRGVPRRRIIALGGRAARKE